MQQGFQSADNSADLLAQVQAAIASHTPLRPRGGGSKDFLGRAVGGVVLDTRRHSGIDSYDPSGLVISAPAGTPLDVRP
ncbi:FAD-binding protein, partial [Staphylococcus aureus]|nr:FAD-binding protein [Staphylococcus aureus]